jgi:hypothetical protein
VLRTISQGIVEPDALIFDSAGNLFVASRSSLFHKAMTSPFTLQDGSSPMRVISQGINTPGSLAFEATGHLFVANFDGNNVTVCIRSSFRSAHYLSGSWQSPSVDIWTLVMSRV